jgi:hypothetical protein
MKRYDLYVYELGSEMIIGWHMFDAVNDHAAIQVTVALELTGRVELWSDAELVKRW